MYLCPECFLQGYCRRLTTHLVTDAEIANPVFVGDLRDHAHALGLSRDAWLDHLMSLYRDYPGRVVGARGMMSISTRTFLTVPASDTGSGISRVCRATAALSRTSAARPGNGFG